MSNTHSLVIIRTYFNTADVQNKKTHWQSPI